MTNILKAIIEAKEKGLTHFGIRGEDRKLAVGAKLDNSFDWDFENDCPSTEKLNGTCATGFDYLWLIDEDDADDLETIKKALEHHKAHYSYSYTYIIAGVDSEYGDDENEVIIGGAEVIFVL